jgi:hypothetical protein
MNAFELKFLKEPLPREEEIKGLDSAVTNIKPDSQTLG